ncbi:helix-turn-helix domain-containing protein [Saccharibacillus qingshengii]|uniref:helix-turn-helix domain-containing protein n=1 Tax=Saccharibacillus qingshengii TaxID=1763540 RepID=UPI001554FDD8|nr:helix-turn-helix transcriptional regulator [Saccharibacillus qingshengii]
MTISQAAASKKIRSWMLENGKSIKWFADQIGVSKSSFGHLLTGTRNWQPKQLKAVAEVMGIPFEQLIDTSDEPAIQQPAYTISLRGTADSRTAKRHLDQLVFAVEDCERIEWMLNRNTETSRA